MNSRTFVYLLFGIDHVETFDLIRSLLSSVVIVMSRLLKGFWVDINNRSIEELCILPSRDLAILCHNVGDLLVVLGGVLLSVIVVPLIFQEYSMIPGLLIPASASVLIGFCLKYLFKTEDVLETRHAMTIAALGWLIAPLFCAVPFVLDANMPFLDAYFESMSGWTVTGLT
ncbi:MAG: hypothetical protein U9N36_08675, partial [Euryarchaeota archaeon]|nr:hypothetical protein [Euryarchaeota archaeon]